MAIIWVLTDERIGNQKQALALAETIKQKYAYDYESKLIRPQGIFSRLPNSLIPPGVFACDTGDLQPPYPKLIISCGRVAACASVALKRADKRIKLLQILNPQAYRQAFDVVILPRHDNRHYKNALLIDGALTDVTPQSVAAAGKPFADRYGTLTKPIIGLLIGGSNKAYRLDGDSAEDIIALIKAWTDKGYSVIGSFSRRTPKDLQMRLLSLSQEAKAGESRAIDFWNGKGDNPYFGILSHSSALVATCDSINMVSEAYHTGKPTYIIGLREKHGGDHKFARFHKAQMTAGRIRKAQAALDFSWTPTPCDDLRRAAEAAKNLLI